MRQLGTVPDQASAQQFADYLLTKGISLSIDPAPGGWALWVRNEDHLDEARREFAEFSAAPDAPIYREASRVAEQLRAEEQRRATAARKNYVNVGQRWRPRGTGRTPVTALLLAASIAVAVISNLGEKEDVIVHLTIDGFVQHKLVHIWEREPWRLVTPIFIHFGMMHIVFNMLMLWQLGIPVERMMGSIRYLILVLAIAIPSNFAQYLWNGPGFGGMSGVVYGLFGYVWMKSRYEPQRGLVISPNSVIFIVGWLFLCMIPGLLRIPVANAAHVGGLVVGIVIGRFPGLWRSMR
jgi:GlpG protein